MKELLVVSGKGGTGKTTVAAALAVLAQDKVIADCDVDAADLHLLLKPVLTKQHEFFGLDKASVDPAKCTDADSASKYADTTQYLGGPHSQDKGGAVRGLWSCSDAARSPLSKWCQM